MNIRRAGMGEGLAGLAVKKEMKPDNVVLLQFIVLAAVCRTSDSVNKSVAIRSVYSLRSCQQVRSLNKSV